MKENKITQTDYYSLSTTTATGIPTPFNNNIISNNFTTAHDLLVYRFSIEISQIKEYKNRIIFRK